MNQYKPFDRGTFPVGVRTEKWTCADGQDFDAEIWYPAAERYRGMDLDEKTCDRCEWPGELDGQTEIRIENAVRDADGREGSYPFVMLVHGWGGFRTESSFMGIHLASHGYLVASVDYPTSTMEYLDHFMEEQKKIGPTEGALRAHIWEVAREREKYIPLLIDQAMTHLDNISGECVGMTGDSYGGWTSYMAPHLDERVTAIVPMCPAGYSDFRHESGAIYIPPIDGTAKQEVRCLAIAGDRDDMVPLPVVLENFKKMKYDKTLVILARAGHDHFVNTVEEWQAACKDEFLRCAEMYPNTDAAWEAAAARVTNGEDMIPGVLSHKVCSGLACILMDAQLKKMPEAMELLEGDLEGACGRIGASVYTVR